MQRLRSLSLSGTILMAVALPTLFALLLGGAEVWRSLRDLRDANGIVAQMDLSVALGNAIHEQQKERGASSIFLNSSGAQFGDELAAQRRKTDEALAGLHQAFDRSADRSPDNIVTIVTGILSDADRMPQIRQSVDQLAISPAEALGYYTDLNGRGIGIVGLIAAGTHNPKIGSDLSGYSAFLMAKERAGIERAIGSGMFASGTFTLAAQLRLQRLVAQQSLALDVFSQHAPAEALDMLADVKDSAAADRLNDMRAVAFAMPDGGLQGITAADYFQTSTERIGAMKALEDHIAHIIVAEAAELAGSKRLLLISLAGLLVVGLGGAVLLSFASCKATIASVIQVVETADTMADGTLDTDVPKVATPEIRRIAEALEKLRDNILDARRKADAENAASIATREAAAREREAHHAAEQARLEEDRRAAEATREVEMAVAADISRVVAACAAGDFSQRLDPGGQSGVLAEICEGLNQIGSITNDGLGAVRTALDHLARGDLTFRMSEDQSGVFRDIAQKVNATGDSMGTSIGTILTSAIEIETSASEVSEAANDLASRSESNAASLEESAAALHQMSVAVSSSTEASNQVRAQVLAIAERARTGNAVVQDTVDAMQKIHESSTRIENTLKLIEDIAHQTNLLALNAGVEAARAGEAGRGFAVVATEVRGLARRSAEAAAEISDIVATATANVSLGMEKAQKSGSELEEIVSGIGGVVTRIEEVTTAASETDLGIREVSKATEDLESNTQKNVAMFEETTAALRVLHSELASLVEAGSAFRLPGRAGPRAHAAPPPLPVSATG